MPPTESKNPAAPIKRLRTLLIPDYSQWVLGTMATAIARHNPWMDALVCPANVIGTLLFEQGKLPFEVDAVHIFSEWDAIRLSPHFQGKVPVINAIHHVEKWEDYRPLLSGDAVQVVSEQWRRFIIEHGAAEDQVVLLPNGIDTAMFCPLPTASRERLRSSLGIPGGSHAIGMFAKRSSNSTGRKAPHIFVEGVQKLAAEGLKITAVIVGPGWGDVVKDLESKGISCVYRPFIPDREGVARMYQALDTYWVTSRIEGGPVPLMEAMACGACCVSTPVGVVPELLQDGQNGFVVGFDDVDAFVARTKLLVTDAELRRRMIDAGRQTIVDKIEWKNVAKQAVPLYARAMERFAGAKGIPVSYDVNQAAALFTEPAAHPRADLPPRLVARLQSLEQYTWFAELLNMDERAAATRFASRALLGSPLDGELWSIVLRTLLPSKLVGVLRRGRRMLRPREGVVGTST
jgi:glycosyltransferase involved in cell wall biosynthesis